MPSDETNAPGLFPSIWRFRWSSGLIVLVCILLSGLGAYVLAPTTTASSEVSLKNPSSTNVLAPNVTSDAATTRYIQQRADFFTSDEVLRQVAEKYPSATVTELRERVTATSTSGSNVITVTARGASASAAADLSRAVVVAYRSVSKQLLSNATTAAAAEISENAETVRNAQKSGALGNTAASATLAALQQQVNAIRTDTAVFGDGVDFVQAASAESATVPGLPLRELGLGFIVGLVIAAIVAWLRADRHRRVTDPFSAQALLAAPLLGIVSKPKWAPTSSSVLSRPAGSGSTFAIDHVLDPQYGLAAAAVQRHEGSGVIVVLGPPRSSERSEVVLNIAMVLASGGQRVLIVDADPEAGLFHRLGAAALEAVPALERERDGVPEILRLAAHDDIEFGLVAPGRTETLSAVHSFVDDLLDSEDRYDLILIDAPSLESSPLVPAVVRAADGIVVVVPSGAEEAAVTNIRRTAEIFSTPIVGYVSTPAH